MKIAYKYRIYPNALQKEYLAKCFGCVRFFYNKSLEDKQLAYIDTKKNINITPAKYKEEHPFLKEIDSLALANAQLAREAAFKNFFKHNAKFPKFKSKKNDQSFTTNNQNGSVRFSENDKYITIPKCKNIRIRRHRDFHGVIKSATISLKCDGKYYISLLVETDEDRKLPENDKIIGLDLGIKSLVIDSNGNKYDNEKYLAKAQKRLEIEQRKLSHMVKGSKNRNKQRIKVAKIHDKVTNKRNDYLHKLSNKLIRENQVIAVETLKVKEMEQNKLVAKSIADVSFAKFITMLEYKANMCGRTLIKVDKFFASSQICSKCGYKNSDTKDLGIRSWICPRCGTTHDRDINAAMNIKSEAIRIIKAGAQPDSSSLL